MERTAPNGHGPLLEERIAVITMNRPKRMNALSQVLP